MMFVEACTEWRANTTLFFTVRKPAEFWFLAFCTNGCFPSGMLWPMTTNLARKFPLMPMKNPPHPGGFVFRQCIEPLGLSITQAAAALGVTRTTLSELVNEKRGISPEIAVRLSQVFGGSAESWLIQQAQYDLAQVRTDRLKLKRLEFA